MDIDHSALTVCGDDHESITIARFFLGKLPNSRTQDWRPIPATDEIGLFLRPALIHPLEPVIYWSDCSVRSGRSEERAVGNFLGSGIDRRRLVGCPVRTHPPSDQVGSQHFDFLVE